MFVHHDIICLNIMIILYGLYIILYVHIMKLTGLYIMIISYGLYLSLDLAVQYVTHQPSRRDPSHRDLLPRNKHKQSVNYIHVVLPRNTHKQSVNYLHGIEIHNGKYLKTKK